MASKAKIIEDMKYRALRQNNKFYSWVTGDYHYITDGIRVMRDMVMPETETSEDAPTSIERMFADENIVYGVEDAVYMDMDLLKRYLKEHRRPVEMSIGDAFVIDYKGIEIGVNPWFLRDQLQYVKDNRLFFRKENPNRNPILSISEDYHTTQALLLPVALSDVYKIDWRAD